MHNTKFEARLAKKRNLISHLLTEKYEKRWPQPDPKDMPFNQLSLEYERLVVLAETNLMSDKKLARWKVVEPEYMSRIRVPVKG